MIRIGIVDDHAVVRSGLRHYLSSYPDLCVTGEAVNGRQALDLARGGEVDVLLLDLGLRDESGIEALASIKSRCPKVAVLVFSGYPETHYATAMLRRGASGYLNKECDPEDIVSAIRTVACGRRYISAAVAELIAASVSSVPERLAHQTFTDRELQVFLRLADGQAVGTVARGLFLSTKTVSTYRTRLLLKLGLHTNGELTYYAVKNGLKL